MKRLTLLAALVLAGACTSAPQKPEVAATSVPVTTPSTASAATIVLGNLTGSSGDADRTMVAEGLRLANAAIGSECFRRPPAWAITHNGGKTWGQIVDDVRAKPWTLNIDLFTGNFAQNHFSHTVGFETEPGTVHMNRYFVHSAYMVGDNAAHELMHSAGYIHASAGESTSAPYTANAKFEECATGGSP